MSDTFQIELDTAAFRDALSIVARVIPTRSPKASLLCVHLGASDGKLQLKGSDGDALVSLDMLRVEVVEPGQRLVPLDKLRAFAARVTTPTLRLTAGPNGSVLLAAGGIKATINGMPDADPPSVYVGEVEPWTTLSVTDLRRGLSACLPAVARENSRYAIRGVALAPEGNGVDFVATDGHRLHKATVPGKSDGKLIVLPARLATLLLAMPGEGDASVETDNQHAVFKGDGWALTGGLVQGNFPPYRDVIPKRAQQTIAVTVGTAELAEALGAASVFVTSETKGVRVKVGEGMSLETVAPEDGRSDVVVSGAACEGGAIELGINPAYALDAVKGAGVESVELSMISANKPVLVMGGDFTGVVMPVNLEGGGA